MRFTVMPVRGMASSDWYLFGVATAFAHKPRSAFGDDIVPSGEGLSSSLVLDIFLFSLFVLVPRIRGRANHFLFDVSLRYIILVGNFQWQAGPTPNGSFICGKSQQMIGFSIIDKTNLLFRIKIFILFYTNIDKPHPAQA